MEYLTRRIHTKTKESSGSDKIIKGLRPLKADLHIHTTASDGRNTLNEMVAAAEAMGWGWSEAPRGALAELLGPHLLVVLKDLGQP